MFIRTNFRSVCGKVPARECRTITGSFAVPEFKRHEQHEQHETQFQTALAKTYNYPLQKLLLVSISDCSQRTPVSPISAVQFVEPPYRVIAGDTKCLALVAEHCIS